MGCITYNHLRKHELTIEEYKEKYKPESLVSRLYREHISKALRGKPKSKEAVRKGSETKKRLFKEGKLHSSMEGRHHSEEIKKKIGLANKGKKRSEEIRRKMSYIRKGRKQPPEAVRKRAEKLKGCKLSVEIRQKISLTHLMRGKKLKKEHDEAVYTKCRELSLKGFRVIPLTTRPIPDGIIIDFQNGKIVALEVERETITPNTISKYCSTNPYDDVYWIEMKKLTQLASERLNKANERLDGIEKEKGG